MKAARSGCYLGSDNVSKKQFSQEDFDQLVEWFNKKRAGTVDAKRPQYASDDSDVLANFRRRAAATGSSVGEIIHHDIQKHVDALGEAVRQGNLTGEWDTPEGAEGCAQKAGDAANLLPLLVAVGVENEQARKQAMREDAQPRSMMYCRFCGGGSFKTFSPAIMVCDTCGRAHSRQAYTGDIEVVCPGCGSGFLFGEEAQDGMYLRCGDCGNNVTRETLEHEANSGGKLVE